MLVAFGIYSAQCMYLLILRYCETGVIASLDGGDGYVQILLLLFLIGHEVQRIKSLHSSLSSIMMRSLVLPFNNRDKKISIGLMQPSSRCSQIPYSGYSSLIAISVISTDASYPKPPFPNIFKAHIKAINLPLPSRNKQFNIRPKLWIKRFFNIVSPRQPRNTTQESPIPNIEPPLRCPIHIPYVHVCLAQHPQPSTGEITAINSLSRS